MEERAGIDLAHASADDVQHSCPGCSTVRYAPSGTFPAVCEICLLAFALEDPERDIPAVTPEGQPSEESRALGSYLLVDEIGHGGMGVIYRAVHSQTGETVALKTILQKYAGCTETNSRFRREAEAASSLDHPNVMPIYEVGDANGEAPFFCMKLAEHGSLHQLMGKYRGRWRQISELMIKIAEAVQYAHDHGVLHRDLKPGNILFGDNHEPLVTDFGLAKRITSSDVLTQSCTILGTPSYISPEQAAGKTKNINESADIYGLGAILYELLTGQPPFVGDNALDVLRQASEQSPLSPRRLSPSIPKALEVICLTCLRRAPEHRYQSAQHLADDLSLWLEGRKIRGASGFLRFSWNPWARPMFYRGMAIALVVAVAMGIAWTIVLHSSSLLPVGTIAVEVEDWSGGSSLTKLAFDTSVALEHCVAQTQVFRLRGNSSTGATLPDATFDPIVYGRRNHAQFVLTGCLRRTGNGVRLTTRLVNCDCGKTVWYRAQNLPSGQADEILPAASDKIVSDLEGRWRANPSALLQPAGPAPSSEAQKLYIRAMELVARTNKRDLDTAVPLMQRAVEIDPDFTLASGTLALTLWTQAEVFGEPDKLSLAMAAARRTLTLDPNSAQAHRVLGSCLSKSARCNEALAEFWTALEIDPQSVGCCQSLAMCLREMGQPRRSIQWLKRATRLDPSRGACYLTLAESFALCGCDTEAEAAYEQSLGLDGEQPEIKMSLGILRTWQKRFAEAQQICADARARMPENRFGGSLAAWIELCAGNDVAAEADYQALRNANSYQQNWDCYGAVNPSSALAYLAKKAGFTERSRSLEKEAFEMDQNLLAKFPQNARILHDLAATCSLAGKDEQALKYLEEAISAGWAERRSTAIDPRFLGVLSHPRFKELAQHSLDSSL